MATMYLKNGERIYVDDDLLPTLEGRTWNSDQGGWVRTVYRHKGKNVTESLAAAVMGIAADRGHVWSHADGNWRNFRRENLVQTPRGAVLFRDITPQEIKERASKAGKKGGPRAARSRRSNDSGYLGVYANGQRFKAMCVVRGKQRYLGLYETPQMAAYAYDEGLRAQGLEAVHKVELPEEVAEMVRRKVGKLLSK